MTPIASSGASCIALLVISCVVTFTGTFALAFVLGWVAHAVLNQEKQEERI